MSQTQNALHVIKAARPTRGTELRLNAAQAVMVNLEFDPGAGVSVDRQGPDLVFVFDDGARIRLAGFFHAGDLPAFRTADGAVVAAEPLLTALNQDIDLLTAAGPGNSSGGLGGYSTDAGSLVNGLQDMGAGAPVQRWGNPGGRALVDGSGVAPGVTSLPVGVVQLAVSSSAVGADGKFVEGSLITVTASVNTPPSNTMYLQLSNGLVIQIAPGQLTGSVSFPGRANDLFKNGESSESISVAGVFGVENQFSNVLSGQVAYTERDDADPTQVLLSLNPSRLNADGTLPEGETLELVVTLHNADPVTGAPVPSESDVRLIITAPDGQPVIVTIPAGSLEVRLDVSQYVRADDNIAQADAELFFSVTGVAQNYDGDYESLDYSEALASLTVVDKDDSKPGGGEDYEAPTITLHLTGLDAAGQIVEGEPLGVYATVDFPTDVPVDLYLSDGRGGFYVLTIPAGELSSQSEGINIRPDDVHKQPEDIFTFTVEDFSMGSYHQAPIIIDGQAATVVDDADTTQVQLSLDPSRLNADGTLPEGESLGLVVSLSNPTDTPLTLSITGPDGQPFAVTIPAGASSATVDVSQYVRANDNISQSDQALNFSVAGVAGGADGNFEALDYSAAQTSITVTDLDDSGGGGGDGDGQAPTLTLHITGTDAQGNIIEGQPLSLHAEISNPSDQPLTVQVSDGRGGSYTLTIPAGATSSQSEAVGIRADDIYQQADEVFSFTADSVSGGNYREDPLVVDGQQATVVDDADATQVQLSLDPSRLNADGTLPEGESLGLVVSLSNPTDTPLTLSITGPDGQPFTVTIPAGASSATVDVSQYVRANDDTSQSDQALNFSVAGVAGGADGNFEALDYSAAQTSITVTDLDDSGGGGGDGDGLAPTLTLHITGTDAQGNIIEGQPLSLHAEISNPSDQPLTVQVADGRGGSYTLTIPAGATSSQSEAVTVRPDDVYQQADDVFSFTADSVNGGNYREAPLVVDGQQATVVDDADATQVSLSLQGVFNPDGALSEGSALSLVVSLDHPTQTPLTLSIAGPDGQPFNVSIPAGQSSATVNVSQYVRADDNIAQADQTLNFSVAGVVGGNDGNFEAVDYSQAETTVTVTDRGSGGEDGGGNGQAPVITLHVAGLDAGGQIVEGGNLGLYATVSVATDEAQSIEVSDGRGGSYTLTIPAGATQSNQAPVEVRPDDVYKEANDLYTFTVDSLSGGHYQQAPTINDGQEATVVDDADATQVSLSLQGNFNPDGSLPEGEALSLQVTLNNAAQTALTLAVTGPDGQPFNVTIPAGQSSVTVDVSSYVRADDSIAQSDQALSFSVSGVVGGADGNFEALNYSQAASSVTVTDRGSGGEDGGGGGTAGVITLHVTGADAEGKIVEGGSLSLYAKVNVASDQPLTMQVSDGRGGSYTLTIPAGATQSNAVPVGIRADDVYKEANDVFDFNVSSVSGGNYSNGLSSSGTQAVVIDDTDAANVSLSLQGAFNPDGSLPEGAALNLLVSLDHPTQAPLTLSITGPDGQPFNVTIPAGQSSATVNASSYVRADDAIAQSDQALHFSVSGVVGGNDGNFEAVNYSQAETTVTVTDRGSGGEDGGGGGTAGVITLHVTGADAEGKIVEGGSLSLYAKVNVASDQPLTMQVSDGRGGVYNLTIPAGSTQSNFAPVSIRADDVYKEANDVFDFNVSSVSGGNYSNGLSSSGTQAVVVDDADPTNVSLSLQGAFNPDGSLAEGSALNLLVSLDHPTQTPLTLSITGPDGQPFNVTIPAGQSSATVNASSYVRADDAIAQSDQTLNFSVSGVVSGNDGNFEAVNYSQAETNVTVTDRGSGGEDGGGGGTAGVITLHVTGADAEGKIVEGNSLSLYARVNVASDQPLTMQVSDGRGGSYTLTIPAGSTQSNAAPVSIRADDVYKEANDVFDFNVSSVSGGNYSNGLSSSGTQAVVIDDADAANVSLALQGNFNPDGSLPEGAALSLLVSVDHPTQTPLTLSITGPDGQPFNVTIPAGQSSATVNVSSYVRADDAIAQADQSLAFSVSGVAGGNDGNFEAVNYSQANDSVVVKDTGSGGGDGGGSAPVITLHVAGLDAAGKIVEGGSNLRIYATTTVATDAPVTLQVADGRGGSYSLTIPAGATQSNQAPVSVRPDDVYKEADDVYTFTVDNLSGGHYSQTPTINDGPRATVVDDADVTNVSLTLQGPFNADGSLPEGSALGLLVSVDHPTQTALTLTLNGPSGPFNVTIPAGQSSATVDVSQHVRADDNIAQSDQSLAFSVSGVAGGVDGNFEALNYSQANDSVVVTDRGSGGGDGGGGGTAGVITLHVTGADAEGKIVEGGSLSLYAKVNVASDQPLTMQVSDGRGGSYTLTIPAGATQSNAVPVGIRADDVYKEANDVFDFNVSSVSGGNYSNGLSSSGTQAVVIDDADATQVSLTLQGPFNPDGSLPEGSTLNLLVSLNNPTQTALTLTLAGPSGPFNVTIPAGQSSTTVDVSQYVRADDNIAQSDQSLAFSVSGVAGGADGNFEALNYSQANDSVVVTDRGSGGEDGGGGGTAGVITLHVTGADAQGKIVEGGSLSLYAKVNVASDQPLTMQVSDGRGGVYNLTIPAGATQSNAAPVSIRADDVYKEANDVFDFNVSSVSGGNYSNGLSSSGTQAVVIDDADATQVSLSLQGPFNPDGSLPEGSTLNLLVSLNNPTQTALTLTLAGPSGPFNVTIPAGQSSTTVNVSQYVRADDAIAQADQNLSFSVSGIVGGADGNFEALNYSQANDSVVVTDRGSGGGDGGGSAPVITLHVAGVDAAGKIVEGSSNLRVYASTSVATDAPVTVQVADGRGGSYSLTIPAGATQSNQAPVSVRPDDVYKEANDVYTFTVNNVSGGHYSQTPTINDGVQATVIDDADVTNVSLTLQGSFNPDGSLPEGSALNLLVSLNNPAQTPLTLSLNGPSGPFNVVVPAGQSSVTVNVSAYVRADDSVIQANESLAFSVSGIVGGADGNFEALNYSQASDSVLVTDAGSSTPDTGISINANDAWVDESVLSGGTRIGQNLSEAQGGLHANGSFQIAGVGGSVTISLGGQATGLSLPAAQGQSNSVTLPAGHPCAGDTLSITNNGNGTYSYEYTLGAAKQHGAPGSGTDSVTDLRLEVQVQSGGQTFTTGTDIHVRDDVITALNPDKIVLEETPPSNYYVTFGLDMSNSMNSSAGIAGDSRTRFQVMKASMLDLLHEYQEVHGDVKINIVLFGSSYQTLGSGLSVSQALSYLNALAAPNSGGSYGYGSTNYAACLNVMQGMVNTGLTNVQYDGYINQAFFISDGEPNAGSSGGSYVPAGWKGLVAGQYADELDVYSIGIGPNSANMQTNLKAVCNPSELNQADGDQYVHVSNMDSLSNILSSLANIQTGNVSANNVLGADGVEQIIGYEDALGVRHDINWAAVGTAYYRIVLADDGQGNNTWLDIKENGDYVLTVNGDVRPAQYDVLRLILMDGDGDTLILPGQIQVIPYDPNAAAPFMASFSASMAEAVPYDDTLLSLPGGGILHQQDTGSGQLIYNGLSDEILHGSVGDDVFVWTQNDLGGADSILDFNLDGDKLFFEGLFNGQSAVNISDLLADHTLSLSMSDASSLELTYNSAGASQTINIQLSEANQSFYHNINSEDPATAELAKAELLHQILINTM